MAPQSNVFPPEVERRTLPTDLLDRLAEAAAQVDRKTLGIAALCLLAVLLVFPEICPSRTTAYLVTGGLALATAWQAWRAWEADGSDQRRSARTKSILLFATFLGTAFWCPQFAVAHPVFKTPLTGGVGARPAVQVKILDADESWFGAPEHYLSAKSSRFPNGTHILLPLNVGNFKGCLVQFVELPFEVVEGDTLSFELLDRDDLSDEQQELLIDSCKTSGYVIQLGVALYCPAAAIASPTIESVQQLLPELVISTLNENPFDNCGTAEFIVRPDQPHSPYEANVLSILDEDRVSRAALRLYYPTGPVEKSSDEL